MSGDLPTLIVEDHPDWWLWDGAMPSAKTVRIDGPLPIVEWLDLSDPNAVSGGHRPLEVGDRVTLAVQRLKFWHEESLDRDWVERPFATATVANVECDEPPQEYEGTVDPVWLVTVTDVEAL